MNKTILIAIIAIVVIIAGGLLVSQYWPEQAGEEQFPADETTDWPASNASRSDAGWQTYRNEEWGFEMKHPVEYNIQDPLGPAQIQIGKVSIYITPDFALYRPEAGGYLGYEPSSESFPQGILLENLLIDGVPFKSDYYVMYGGMGSWSSGINVFTQDKHNGNYYIISLDFTGFEDTPPETILNTTDGGCRDNCLTDEAKDWLGAKMKEGARDETKIFHQILSTFKFID